MDRALVTALRYGQALMHAASTTLPVNKRLLSRNIVLGALILVIFIQFFLISSGTSSSNASGSDPVVLLRGHTYLSHYDTLLKHYKSDEFIKKPLKERCNIFFDTLNSKSPGWKLDDFSTEGHGHQPESFQEYLEKYLKDHPDEKQINNEKEKALEDEYNKKTHSANKVNSKVVDYVSTLRIFSKCFIEDETLSSSALTQLKGYWSDRADDKNAGHLQDICFDTEARIFPWLSNILPTFQRWDGSVSSGYPELDVPVEYERFQPFKYSDEEEEGDKQAAVAENVFEKRAFGRSSCLLKTVRNSINGKGYVISASDEQVAELTKLALTLRVIGNKLPIQIVHKGDLSVENQKKLITLFRNEVDLVKLQDLFEEFEINDSSSLTFPPQEVWFVNVKDSIKKEYASHFDKYANKLLAYLFNSFEDMILLDTDTVPFVQLDKHIFGFPEYQTKGAYFFHDREVDKQNSKDVVEFYKKLFPSPLDSHFFQIPTVTDFTLRNRFIGDKRHHFMESGVVAINRKRHFTGMLTSLQLNFWAPINQGNIHGEKELFWLGLSVAGDEEYFFNEGGAASIGELTPTANRRLPHTKARELCSNHPGHIDGHDKQTLLWINSGMTYCKNLGAIASDLEKPLYKGRYTEASLKKLYTSGLKIRAAIIPPPQEIKDENTSGNPIEGWTDLPKYCGDYTWCAYDFIGSGSQPEHFGTYIQFKKHEYKWFDFVGELWMTELPSTSYLEPKTTS
jgi:alpha 1,3-mannosyltransferase